MWPCGHQLMLDHDGHGINCGSLSGPPHLPWSQPVLGEEEIAEVVDTLRSGWLTTGPKAARFETEIASRLGVERAFAVTSCTAALHLALLVTGIGPGDEVISPSLTFCAAVNVIAHCGALPVLVDVEAETLNVDPEAVEAAVTARTRAIIAMHYAGQPCDMDSLGAIARRFGLVLIEDAGEPRHPSGSRAVRPLPRDHRRDDVDPHLPPIRQRASGGPDRGHRRWPRGRGRLA